MTRKNLCIGLDSFQTNSFFIIPSFIPLLGLMTAPLSPSKGKNIVMVTGERKAESTARGKYLQTQYYCQQNSRRTVYQHHPVIDWTTEQVWAKIAEYKIVPHPAYQLGWGRTSCLGCIFGSHNQWATIRQDFPDRFEAISNLEVALGHTIDNKLSIIEMADRVFPDPHNPKIIALANSGTWDSPVFIED